MPVPNIDFAELEKKAANAISNGDLSQEWLQVGMLLFATISELQGKLNMIWTLANAPTTDPRWYLAQISEIAEPQRE